VFKAKQLSVCAGALGLLGAFAGVQPRELDILGKVIGQDVSQVPVGWVAMVSAIGADDKTVYQQRPSRGDLFLVKAPVPVKIYLAFEANNYEPLQTDVIRTSDNPYYLSPDATLTPIRPDPKDMASDQKRERHLKLLKRQKEVTRATHSYDIYQFNMEVRKYVYREDVIVMTEIRRFEEEVGGDPDFQVLKTPEFRSRAELFRHMVEYNYTRKSDVDAQELLKLIKDAKVFPGIRSNGISVFGDIGLPGQLRESGVQYLREGWRSFPPELTFPAFTAMAKQGNQQDKQVVLNATKSSNPDVSLTSMAAIGAARLGEGSKYAAEVLRVDINPFTQEAAVDTLTVLQEDPDSVGALLAAAGRTDLPQRVRLRAIRALGDLSKPTPGVRAVLEIISTTDTSAVVREAALFSLQKIKKG
jgi:hypothetical protein